MMQTWFQKFLKKYCIVLICTLQILDSQAQTRELEKADKLFSERKFVEANKIYENHLKTNLIIHPNIYLKLANIAELNEDYTKELYYLNLYFLKKPNEKVFEKMFEISANQGFKGYEKNDLNYFLFYYKQFSIYIIIGFVILGLYIFGVLIWKKKNKQFIPSRHKIILLIYLIGLFTLINLPNNYNSAIVRNDNSFLRNFPSNAAAIVGNIKIGNKINVMNKDDIWLHVLWEGNLCYIKESDVYLIK